MYIRLFYNKESDTFFIFEYCIIDYL